MKQTNTNKEGFKINQKVKHKNAGWIAEIKEKRILKTHWGNIECYVLKNVMGLWGFKELEVLKNNTQNEGINKALSHNQKNGVVVKQELNKKEKI